jgi:hypothetical protein
VIQRALGASCVRVRDGETSGAGRRISADERIAGRGRGHAGRLSDVNAAGAVLSFPAWMGPIKTESDFASESVETKVCADASALQERSLTFLFAVG